MCALSLPAVRPIAGGLHRRAATAPSDASEPASGKKRPRAAPARDSSSSCHTKKTRNSVVTPAGGEMSSKEILKKAEVISQRGACKGGAPTADKKERFLASKQRPKPTQEDVPSLKKSKISMRLDKLFSEESKDEKLADESKDDDKVAEESKDDKVAKEEEYADISGGLSCLCIIETGSKPSLSSRGDSDDAKKVVQQSAEAKKVQDALQRAAASKAVNMRDLLYRANLRRQLLEMERGRGRSCSVSAIPASYARSGSSSRSSTLR